MRTYEIKTETVERTTLVKTTCDLCGKEATRGGGESSFYEVNETEVEVTVRQKDGRSYPDNGSGTKVNFDICPDCFKNKLIPFLESQGAKVERTEWDF